MKMAIIALLSLLLIQCTSTEYFLLDSKLDNQQEQIRALQKKDIKQDSTLKKLDNDPRFNF